MRLSLSLTLSLSLSPSALSPSTKWGTLGTRQIVGCDEMMFGEDEEEEKSGITTYYHWVWSFFLGLAGQRD
jgi:hypothetical protein